MSVFTSLIDISSFFIGILINLLLIALICYYFKRKIDNLELAQSEQAKMLYNIIHQQQQQMLDAQNSNFSSQNIVSSETKELSFLDGIDLDSLNDTGIQTSQEAERVQDIPSIMNNSEYESDNNSGSGSESESETESEEEDENHSDSDSDDEEPTSNVTTIIGGQEMVKSILYNEEVMKSLPSDDEVGIADDNNSQQEQDEDDLGDMDTHEHSDEEIKTIQYDEYDEDAEENVDEAINYEKMTIKELKVLLEQKGMSNIKRNAKKQELIQMLSSSVNVDVEDQIDSDNDDDYDKTVILSSELEHEIEPEIEVDNEEQSEIIINETAEIEPEQMDNTNEELAIDDDSELIE